MRSTCSFGARLLLLSGNPPVGGARHTGMGRTSDRHRFARRVAAVVALAAALLLLAACGDDDTEVGAPSGPDGRATTVPGDAPVTGPPLDGPGSGATRVEPDPSAVDARPVPFDPATAVASDVGVVVQFESGVAPCYVLQRVEVTETPDTVEIGLFVGTQAGAEDAVCIEIAQLYEVEVPLDAPLGDRTVVDANA